MVINSYKALGELGLMIVICLNLLTYLNYVHKVNLSRKRIKTFC